MDTPAPVGYMTRDQVRAFDAWAIGVLGLPGAVLMENAGRGCAEFILDRCPLDKESRVAVLCGTGNNGGDGFVIARHLANRGLAVTVMICGPRARISGDALMNLRVAEGLGIAMQEVDPAGDLLEVRRVGANSGLLVDALFGTGLKGPLPGTLVRLIETVNALGRPVVAVDVPSGLDCDTGEPLGAAIRARWTVTLVALKKGMLSASAATYLGEVSVASIGVEPLRVLRPEGPG